MKVIFVSRIAWVQEDYIKPTEDTKLNLLVKSGDQKDASSRFLLRGDNH